MNNKKGEPQQQLKSPLYLQIKENILSRIESEGWKENYRLPTEKELCQEFQVSTITVREALKQLANEGRIIRIPGKGTFVTKPKVIARLDNLFSTTRWGEVQDMNIVTRIIRIESQPCSQYLQRHLNIKEGENVTLVERLRLGDMEPLMFEFVWIPSRLCPNLHLQDMSKTPLHDILRNVYKIPLTRAVESLEPVMPDKYIRQIMGLDEKKLLLKIEHRTYTTNERMILFANSYYRGDRYKFVVDL